MQDLTNWDVKRQAIRDAVRQRDLSALNRLTRDFSWRTVCCLTSGNRIDANQWARLACEANDAACEIPDEDEELVS